MKTTRHRAMSTKLTAKRIDAALLRLGVSPEQFESIATVSGRTVRRAMEPGHAMRRRTAHQIAEGLGLRPEDLWPVD